MYSRYIEEVFQKFMLNDTKSYGTFRGIVGKEKYTASMILDNIIYHTSPKVKETIWNILKNVTTKKQMQIFCREYVKLLQQHFDENLAKTFKDCNL